MSERVSDTELVQATIDAVDSYRSRYYNLQDQDGDLEMETRFGRTNREGRSELSLAAFVRVHEFLNKQPGVTSIMHEAEISSMNIDAEGEPNPRTIRRSRNEGGERWELKTRLGVVTSRKFPIRFGYALEQEMDPYPEEHFEPDVVRKYQRISVTKEGVCRVDMSIVTYPDNPDKKYYELEVEANPNILVSERHRNLYVKFVSLIYGRVLNSNVLYDIHEYNSVIRDFNRLLGSQKSFQTSLDTQKITQARNIKYPDMVKGGMVGNNQTTYNMTHKTDGVRKFFFVYRQGFYLISGNSEVNKIGSHNSSKWNGTILDCELLPPSARRYDFGAPKVNYWLIVLDCISLAGKDMTMYSHLDRLMAGQKVADNFKSGNILRITTKSFKNLGQATDLFNNSQMMMNQIPTLAYKTDGFMFVPNDKGYIPHTENPNKLPLYARRMTKVGDIAKWKPTDEITIDFVVNKIDGQYKLFSGSYGPERQYMLVEFVGNQYNPYDGKIIENDLLLISNDGAILEFEWLSDQQAFRAKVARADKPKPNRLEIALDNWGDIHNSITDDVMRGQTLNFMRKYHNREKRELFKTGVNYHHNPCLLDIGTGRGGDLAKMSDYEKIVMVEPNITHIMELLERMNRINDDKAFLVTTPEMMQWAQSYITEKGWTHVTLLETLDSIKPGLPERVLILNVGGEHPEFIRYAVQAMFGRLADVVSMMFSLSFFWSSPEMLDALAKTISMCSADYSHFIYATVDGPAVRELFQGPTGSLVDSPVCNVVSDGSKVVALGVENQDIYRLSLEGNVLNVSFPNTIVAATDLETEVQVEWLVEMEQLHSFLFASGFKSQSYERLTKESFLSEPERILTKLYYAGVSVRGEQSGDTPMAPDIKLSAIAHDTVFDIQPIEVKKDESGLLDMGSMIDAAIAF